MIELADEMVRLACRLQRHKQKDVALVLLTLAVTIYARADGCESRALDVMKVFNGKS